MPDLSLLFAFWNPEMGFNYNLIVSWVLVLVLSKVAFPKVLEKISDLLLKVINKIPLLENTDLDERFFGAVGSHLATKVMAKMSQAKAIKNAYHVKIAAALKKQDGAAVTLLSKEMLDELEGLTKGIRDEFFSDGEALLWKKLIEKYGDKASAGKWVYDKVKALVEEMKSPDHPSTSALIAKHLFNAGGDLGKSPSTGGSAG